MNPNILQGELLAELLRKRRENAKKYNTSYEHVFRKKTYFELIRMSSIAFGIELIYAAETGFVSAILLKTGLAYSEMALVWSCPPVVELIITPLIGSFSDRCKSRIGRRRPFLIMLSLILLFGLLLLAYGQSIGYLLGDVEVWTVSKNATNSTNTFDPADILSKHKNGVVFIVIGLFLMDATVDVIHGPATTFLLEMCPPQDETKALSTYTFMTSFGGILGYSLCGINWNKTKLAKVMGGNMEAVFTIIAILFFISFVITVTSNREIPLKLIEQDSLLRPLTVMEVKSELDKANGSKIEEQTVSNDSIKYFLRSIFIMPRSMFFLCLFTVLGWSSQICYYLFFTDFVGEAVFHGAPYERYTEASLRYEEGVRFGCWGLLLHDVGCLAFSLSEAKVIKLIGLKWTNFTITVLNGILIIIMGIFPLKWISLILSFSPGVLYAALLTIPNILMTRYHTKCFEVKKGKCVQLKRRRGFGTDINIVTSMSALSQILGSLMVGKLVERTNNTSYYMYMSGAFSFATALSSLLLLYLD